MLFSEAQQLKVKIIMMCKPGMQPWIISRNVMAEIPRRETDFKITDTQAAEMERAYSMAQEYANKTQ